MPNPQNGDPNEMEMQPLDRELYLLAKSQHAAEQRPKTGPVANARPAIAKQRSEGLRPKTGPLSTQRPKTAPVDNSRRKTGPVPMPNAFPADEGMDLSIEGGTAPAADPRGSRAFLDDGPGPSEKVDFENLPEFVKQRRMLKIARIGGLIAGIIITIALGSWIYLTFWGARKAVDPVLHEENSVENNNRTLEETK